MTFKCAHISDIHFFNVSWNPLQIFSKRFLGNLNLLTFRKGLFDPRLPHLAADFIHQLGISHLVISGDFTCTSSKKEFQQAQTFMRSLIDKGFKIYTIPGNHDTYTKNSCKNRLFYQYFDGLIEGGSYEGFNLNQDRVAAHPLIHDWYLVSIDCAYSTPYTKSTGLFSSELENRLKELLLALPRTSKLLFFGHFPLGQFKYPRAHLERAEKLQEILFSDNRIKAYIHGHRHNQELFHVGNILVADSGSIACQKTSSFNLLELSKERCKITTFQKNHMGWEENYFKETF